MKIGILTHPIETNYGGLLQAFALQKVLKELGHEVYTIDRYNKIEYNSIFEQFLGFVKRNKEYYIDQKQVATAWNPFLTESEKDILSSETIGFVKRNIQVTRKVESHQLHQIDKEYLFDAYVVGSDQVWLPGYCPTSFLDFVKRKDVIKMFYAASAGKRSFADDNRLCATCRLLAQSFNGISVREDKLVQLSKDKLGRNAELVLDPTFLLMPKDYISAIKTTKISRENTLFVYLLDKEKFKLDIIDNVCSLLGLTPYYANVEEYYLKGVSKDIRKCIFPSVDSWIENLNNAKFVITDSFHGTALSILFNKQFLSIGNTNRGIDRFYSLLGTFNLTDRLVLKNSDYQRTISKIIDYDITNMILASLRKKSIKYITDILNK